MRGSARAVDEAGTARSFLTRDPHLMSRSRHDTPDLLAGPPPEVLVEIEAAWERAQELELDFEIEGGRAFGSVTAPDGSRRRISATRAVLAACGDALVPPPVAVPV
jgi:hypothetical protein